MMQQNTVDYCYNSAKKNNMEIMYAIKKSLNTQKALLYHRH